MLDLSVFAIGLVTGWAAMFLRWPAARAGLRARLLVAAVWLGWALVSVLLVDWTGGGMGWAIAGVGLGVAGHAMMAVRLQDVGRSGGQS